MKPSIEILSKKHSKKSEFSCGNDLLDHYLHYQAGQDMKRKLSVCFILQDSKTGLIQGYYTLSNNSIPLTKIPDHVRKKLPSSYKSIPATLLGRLAIDQRFKGKGLGSLLLIDALNRCLKISESIGSFAVIVDPIDEHAQSFYEKYGFFLLPGSGKMFIPIQKIRWLLG